MYDVFSCAIGRSKAITLHPTKILVVFGRTQSLLKESFLNFHLNLKQAQDGSIFNREVQFYGSFHAVPLQEDNFRPDTPSKRMRFEAKINETESERVGTSRRVYSTESLQLQVDPLHTESTISHPLQEGS